MNRKYLYVFLITAVLLTVCELYPPFLYDRQEMHSHYSAGYHWYLNPPKVPTQEEADIIVYGKPQEGAVPRNWTKNGWKDGPKQYIALNLRVLQNTPRQRGQEILIIFAALGACLFVFSRRLFIALFLPGLLETTVFLVMGFILYKLDMENMGFLPFFLLFILLFVPTACASIFFLREAWFNRFWKTYLFSIASALLPWLMASEIAATFSRTAAGGSFWLGPFVGLIYIWFIVVATTIVALPITYQFYKSWLD